MSRTKLLHHMRNSLPASLFFIPLIALAIIATAAQIAEAIRSSPNANQWLRQNAEAVANLAINVESRGNTQAFNGSCCHGVLQMNEANIAAYAKVPPDKFRNWSLQQQIDAWSALTVDALSARSVQTLANMATFDGRQVDGNLVLACIQLGIGNCQRMINSGRCAGFADRNGTTICGMADRISGNQNPVAGSGTGGTNSGSGTSAGIAWTGGYNPEPSCVRNSSGACVPITDALQHGFLQGSGVSMDQLKWNIHAIIVAIVLLVMGSASYGLWQQYVRGNILKADLVLNMQRIGIIVSIILLIMSLT